MTNANTLTRSKVFKNSLKTEFYTDSEVVQMSIDESAFGHIMERLIDLYQNPLEAAIRETVSNAIDASIQKQLSGEVVKPVFLDVDVYTQTVSIRDYGIGMSKEEIVNIYSKYGSSTKSLNLNTIGAYGLGAKAPLSYVDTFIITTVKDNYKTVGVVTRTNKVPEIKIVSHEATTEESGTEISFILKNEDDITKALELIRKYYYFSDFVSVPLEIPESQKNFSYLKNYYTREECFVSLDENKPTKIETITISIGDEDVLLDVYLSQGAKKQGIDYFLDNKIKYSFVFEGYEYNDNNFYGKSFFESPLLYVNLVPGMFDFDSSRDNIQKNEKYRQVMDLIEQEVKHILPIENTVLNSNNARSIFRALTNNKISLESIKNLTYSNILLTELYDNTKDYIQFLGYEGNKSNLNLITIGEALIRTVLSGNELVVILDNSEKAIKYTKKLSEEFSNIFFVDSKYDTSYLEKFKGIEFLTYPEVRKLFSTKSANNRLVAQFEEYIYNKKENSYSKRSKIKLTPEEYSNESDVPVLVTTHYDNNRLNKSINTIANKHNLPSLIYIMRVGRGENSSAYRFFDKIPQDKKLNLYYSNSYYYLISEALMRRIHDRGGILAKETEYLKEDLNKNIFMSYINKRLNYTLELSERLSDLRYDENVVYNPETISFYKEEEIVKKVDRVLKIISNHKNTIQTFSEIFNEEDVKDIINKYNEVVKTEKENFIEYVKTEYNSLP